MSPDTAAPFRLAPPPDASRRFRTFALLGQLAHGGLVEATDIEPDGTLVCPRLTPLARRPKPTAAEARQFALDIASTLADLHASGVVHGRLSAEHVLISSDGHAVLCGVRTDADLDEPVSPADDVAALSLLLREWAGNAAEWLRLTERDRSAMQLLRTLADEEANQPTTAAEMLDRLLSLGTSPSAPAMERSRFTRRSVAYACAVTVVAVAAGVLVARSSENDPAQVQPLAQAPITTVVSPAAGPIVHSGSKWLVAGAGEIVEVGSWNCKQALPVVLRVDTGDLYTYDSWGNGVSARFVANIPGAKSLARNTNAAGCDVLAVRTPNADREVPL